MDFKISFNPFSSWSPHKFLVSLWWHSYQEIDFNNQFSLEYCKDGLWSEIFHRMSVEVAGWSTWKKEWHERQKKQVKQVPFKCIWFAILMIFGLFRKLRLNLIAPFPIHSKKQVLAFCLLACMGWLCLNEHRWTTTYRLGALTANRGFSNFAF